MTTNAPGFNTYVQQAQQLLTGHGFDCGVADGLAGPKFLACITAAIEGKPGGGQSGLMHLHTPDAFFSVVREKFGKLNLTQVAGFEVLLKAMTGWRAEWVAYGLATSWHETGATMQPIKEYGGPSYFHKMYDINGSRPAKARELGNLTPGDGALFAGRGYVQITGRINYRKFGIESSPDDAMKTDVAARILIVGMERGSFTGRALKDYAPEDFKGMRKIINGTDKDDEIAAYAVKFLSALRAGMWQ